MYIKVKVESKDSYLSSIIKAIFSNFDCVYISSSLEILNFTTKEPDKVDLNIEEIKKLVEDIPYDKIENIVVQTSDKNKYIEHTWTIGVNKKINNIGVKRKNINKQFGEQDCLRLIENNNIKVQQMIDKSIERNNVKVQQMIDESIAKNNIAVQQMIDKSIEKNNVKVQKMIDESIAKNNIVVQRMIDESIQKNNKYLESVFVTKEEFKRLEQRVEKLEIRMDALEKRVEALEKKVDYILVVLEKICKHIGLEL